MARTADDWERLGRIVRRERKEQGFRDTTKWAQVVGRSSRVLLGLERGEPTGEETLELVSEALNYDSQWAALILEDRRRTAPVGPGDDTLAFVAKAGDRPAGPTLTDEEVLALIRENRRLADELERRMTGGSP